MGEQRIIDHAEKGAGGGDMRFEDRLERHGEGLSIIAPAKLTLYLHAVGRRHDGYHLLESIFVFTKGGDRVTVKPSDHLTLTLDGPFAGVLADQGGSGDDNLVMRAARLLADAMGVEAKAAIHLDKILPVAAGVGGGSSDAAACLIALRALWMQGINGTTGTTEATEATGATPVSDADLHDLALQLGADVPACLAASPQFVQGVGDILSPLSAGDRLGVLLANPNVPLSTPAVFRAFAAENPIFSLDHRFAITDPMALARDSRNDLTRAAVKLCPQLAEGIDALLATEAPVLIRMAGSGATLFTLYESRDDAARAASAMAKACPDWWLYHDDVIMPQSA